MPHGGYSFGVKGVTSDRHTLYSFFISFFQTSCHKEKSRHTKFFFLAAQRWEFFCAFLACISFNCVANFLNCYITLFPWSSILGGEDVNNQPVHAFPLWYVHTCKSRAELRKGPKVILKKQTTYNKSYSDMDTHLNRWQSSVDGKR